MSKKTTLIHIAMHNQIVESLTARAEKAESELEAANKRIAELEGELKLYKFPEQCPLCNTETYIAKSKGRPIFIECMGAGCDWWQDTELNEGGSESG